MTGDGKDWTASFHDMTDFWKLSDASTDDTESASSTCSMSVRHFTTACLSAAFMLATYSHTAVHPHTTQHCIYITTTTIQQKHSESANSAKHNVSK